MQALVDSPFRYQAHLAGQLEYRRSRTIPIRSRVTAQALLIAPSLNLTRF
jgi:hypothetical protein